MHNVQTPSTMTATDIFHKAFCMCAPTSYSQYADYIVEDSKYDTSHYRSHDTTFMDDYDDDASMCSKSNMVMGHIVKKPTFHHSASSSKFVDGTPVSSLSESKMRMITPAAPIPSWSYLDYHFDEDGMDEDDDDDVVLNSLLAVPQLAPTRLTPPEPSHHRLHQPHGLRRVSSITTASTASLTCVESTDISLDTEDERDDSERSRTSNSNKQLEGSDFDISSSLCTEIVENYGLSSKSPISFVSYTQTKEVPPSGKSVFRGDEQQQQKQISYGQEETKEEPEDYDEDDDMESYCVLVRMTHDNYVH